MKKTSLLFLSILIAVTFVQASLAQDYRHHRDHDSSLDTVGDWYNGHWTYGVHGDTSGWWWITPGGGWNLFPEAVYPYPDPPIPIPPPAAVPAQVMAPPVVVTSPYYGAQPY